jgi:hypothetical protein
VPGHAAGPERAAQPLDLPRDRGDQRRRDGGFGDLEGDTAG